MCIRDSLVVDEVLAVGDLAFQKKCMGKMSEAAQGGRTVLFVSHNLSAVSRLCSKAILLESGRPGVYGTAGGVGARHLCPYPIWSGRREALVKTRGGGGY